MKKYLVLGASRGLGAAVLNQLQQQGQIALGFSRKTQVSIDFTKSEEWEKNINYFSQLNPTHIIYTAGGGPYGFYADKQFKDHQWTMKLNFEFPAFLLHSVLSQPQLWPNLKQIAFVGSSVAESEPDPMAASYCAAKHALKGLLDTIIIEAKQSVDIKLYSPGYFDSDLLPKNAWPRRSQQPLSTVDEVAGMLLKYLEK